MNGIIPFVVLVLFSTGSYSNTNYSNVEVDIGRLGDADKVSRIIKLTQVDNMFLPAEVKVSEGETIRFVVKNGGNHPHEMLLGSMAELKKVANMRRMYPDKEHSEAHLLQLEPGEQKELIWQFTRVGTIDFACPLPGHFKKMHGTIIVEKK
ncbi:plastocyanin/azurin family copper-binding protein [Nitrosomonas sp. Is35]|uniref:cupredoxin domain-containing protein n=1 Tax=unclassified Nitrosomonas TaxID=2609265 RepID=UPI00294B36DF|nr:MULTISPECIES: plastocyanin/azurin family copper-binding protein [unclassified Nitrosomonas]MDV6340172.1 plastocyanin/azurin family copper-binding protein [Nitrosomonas sp. Is24]MDV6345918.1 plastocyanin/azurin family copper-binding protein [Nitrosomonas sp. Is35]